jgi:hypothetical protein
MFVIEPCFFVKKKSAQANRLPWNDRIRSAAFRQQADPWFLSVGNLEPAQNVDITFSFAGVCRQLQNGTISLVLDAGLLLFKSSFCFFFFFQMVVKGLSAFVWFSVPAHEEALLEGLKEIDPVVEIGIGSGVEWPDSKMAAQYQRDLNSLSAGTTYNFRFRNPGTKQVVVNFEIILVSATTGSPTTPPAGRISGADALAMILTVIGVFIVFSILAAITMRHMPSPDEGTLVVEEEFD